MFEKMNCHHEQLLHYSYEVNSECFSREELLVSIYYQ